MGTLGSSSKASSAASAASARWRITVLRAPQMMITKRGASTRRPTNLPAVCATTGHSVHRHARCFAARRSCGLGAAVRTMRQAGGSAETSTCERVCEQFFLVRWAVAVRERQAHRHHDEPDASLYGLALGVGPNSGAGSRGISRAAESGSAGRCYSSRGDAVVLVPVPDQSRAEGMIGVTRLLLSRRAAPCRPPDRQPLLIDTDSAPQGGRYLASTSPAFADGPVPD
jgi:hypothetical protein